MITPLHQAPCLPDVDGAGLLIAQDGDTIALRWSAFGAYRVSGGDRVEYEAPAHLSESAVRVPLLGVCMGLLLHQRGLLTLHASAVAVGDGAVAFVGEKGAGKSTMTAALVRRGHPLLSDDVVALDPTSGSGPPRVRPGIGTIKLWPDSVDAVGVDPNEVPRLYEDVDKRVLPAAPDGEACPRPLRCIYVLEQGDRVTSAPVSPIDAFSELLHHTYAARFLGEAAGGPPHLQQCAAVVRDVAFRRLVRTGDLEDLEALVERVEEEWGATQAPLATRGSRGPTATR